MSIMIQLRNVPDDLHRRLKMRAAQEGRSLSDYLIHELRDVAARPTAEELQARFARRSRVRLKESPAETVHAERAKR